MNLIDKIKSNFYWFPSLFMIGDAILKIMNASLINECDIFSNLQDKWIYIGVVELLSVVFFLFKSTMLIGFFLVCTFLGGVIGGCIVLNISSYLPIVVLFAFGLALYWRAPLLLITISYSNRM
ncbi:MAG: hypothetical protein AB7S48_05645 [Bacteroidales bacterium]